MGEAGDRGVLRASLRREVQGCGSVASPPKRIEGGPGPQRVKSILEAYSGSQAQAGLHVLGRFLPPNWPQINQPRRSGETWPLGQCPEGRWRTLPAQASMVSGQMLPGHVMPLKATGYLQSFKI